MLQIQHLSILLSCETMTTSNTIWVRVNKNLKKIAEDLSRIKGITLSEYVRSLIIEDLDKRSIFTTKIKEEQFNSSDQIRPPRFITPKDMVKKI